MNNEDVKKGKQICSLSRALFTQKTNFNKNNEKKLRKLSESEKLEKKL